MQFRIIALVLRSESGTERINSERFVILSITRIISILFVCCLSFIVNAEEKRDSALSITNSFLASPFMLEMMLKRFHNDEVVRSFAKNIEVNGGAKISKCFLNHNSLLFDTVTCHLEYKNNTTSSIWEFFYFNDQEVWVGTNIVLIEELADDRCYSNFTLKKGILKGLNYDSTDCDG